VSTELLTTYQHINTRLEWLKLPNISPNRQVVFHRMLKRISQSRHQANVKYQDPEIVPSTTTEFAEAVAAAEPRPGGHPGRFGLDALAV
jgi:hypothetical protein